MSEKGFLCTRVFRSLPKEGTRNMRIKGERSKRGTASRLNYHVITISCNRSHIFCDALWGKREEKDEPISKERGGFGGKKPTGV